MRAEPLGRQGVAGRVPVAIAPIQGLGLGLFPEFVEQIEQHESVLTGKTG